VLKRWWVVPIRLSARDIFVRCAAALVLAPVTLPQAPPVELVQSLFDLTPAEARVARSLASGKTVEDIATDGGTSGSGKNRLQSPSRRRRATNIDFLDAADESELMRRAAPPALHRASFPFACRRATFVSAALVTASTAGRACPILVRSDARRGARRPQSRLRQNRRRHRHGRWHFAEHHPRPFARRVGEDRLQPASRHRRASDRNFLHAADALDLTRRHFRKSQKTYAPHQT
jgi:hypothetical protein